MNIKKIISAVLILGVLVTTPTFNSADLDLPAAITDAPTSSVIARIGKVVGIVESDNITVAISGSPTLVNASYLFPQYQPVLGDRVYVAKQDAQWMVLGTLSGEINTSVPNPSFELGTTGATPTDWTVTPVVTTAGTPTFRKEQFASIAGQHTGTFRNSSAGVAGNSSVDVFSAAVPTVPDTNWTLAYYITYAVPDINASLAPQGGFMDLTGYIQFLDATSALISETQATYTPMYSPTSASLYVRTITSSFGLSAQAPAGTAFVRIRFRATFVMHVNSASEFAIDYVVLRQVG